MSYASFPDSGVGSGAEYMGLCVKCKETRTTGKEDGNWLCASCSNFRFGQKENRGDSQPLHIHSWIAYEYEEVWGTKPKTRMLLAKLFCTECSETKKI